METSNPKHETAGAERAAGRPVEQRVAAGNLYRRGGVWGLRFQVNGRCYRWSLGTHNRKDARRKAEPILREIERDGIEEYLRNHRTARRDTFGAAWRHYVAAYLGTNVGPSWRSIQENTYGPRFLEFFGAEAPLGSITAERIEEYRGSRREGKGDEQSGVANATINRETASLRRFFTVLLRWGWIRRHPMTYVQKLREAQPAPRAVSPEDVARVLDATQDSPEHVRRFLHLMAYLGLRNSEAARLRWRDVDFDAGRVFVESTPTNPTKSYKSRVVPAARELLDFLRPLQGAPEAFVVSLPDGSSVAPNTLSQAASKLFKRAAVSGSAYTLRHSFATILLLKGVAPHDAKDAMGHHSLTVTEKYFRPHLLGRQLPDLSFRKAVEAQPATAARSA